MNKMRNEEHRRYDRMVKALTPNSNYIQGYLRAFWVGGVICTIGQLISLWGEKGMGLSESSAAMLTSVILIFLGTTLTGIGVYDDIGHYAGAGSIVPITGFANSIAAPAIEFKREGLILGVGAKLFVIAGPVLVYGIASSIVVGVIYVADWEACGMKQTLLFKNRVAVRARASIVGKKEGAGPLGGRFDVVLDDDLLGQKSWELAESEMLRRAACLCLERGGLDVSALELITAGDLINQLMPSSLMARSLGQPFLGLYGACSTFAEGALIGGAMVEGGFRKNALCAASSHFCTAERAVPLPAGAGHAAPSGGAVDGHGVRAAHARGS